MRRKLRVVALGLLLGACSQDSAGPGGGGGGQPPSPLNVSNATIGSGAALNVTRGASARNAAPTTATANRLTNGARLVAASTTADNVAYVSVDPHTYPGGESATIGNARSNATIVTQMVDGGFDPVPITAAAGDNIDITIHAAGGATLATLSMVVPPKRPPKVVRTIPGRGKTGVPLNSNIEVVFTEPVAPASLSSSSVQLLHAGAAVAGSVHVLDGVTAAIVFTPASELQANSAYELVITQGIRDLDGDALDSAVRVPFTTGTTRVGPIASLTIIPDNADVIVGDQFQLFVVAEDAQGEILTGLPVVWATTDPRVITVSTTGLATARGEGTAFIDAEVNGLFAAIYLHVSGGLRAVESVTLSVDSLSMTPAGKFDLAAVARDADGNLLESRLVQFTSSNSQVASVVQAVQGETAPPGNSGPLANVPPISMYRATVTGVANGVARIFATIGGKSDTAVVTVAASFPPVGLALSVDTATVLLHSNLALWGAAVNAAGGRDSLAGALIQWETSNADIATIDAGGRVTANAAGVATITARWSAFSATAKITVVQIAVRAVSPGRLHTCALTVDNDVYCWGGNEVGQAGFPAISGGRRTFVQRLFTTVPVRAAPGFKFDSITSGGFHTCGLVRGVQYCWGYNADGSLGAGVGNFEDSWRPVGYDRGYTLSQIDAGTTHTCAVTTTNVAYCWGLNRAGELGVSDATSSGLPLVVSGGHSFASISVGGSHTCALTSDGVAFCWGDNAAGQLGVGESVTSSAAPLPVSGGLTFSSLSAGESHTCGVTRSGQIYCWGWNFESQLGSGVALAPSPVPVAVASTQAFTAVAAGTAHTCAIDSSGAAWCWGQNQYGQAGVGAPGSELFATPQRVTGGLVFDQITAGRAHTCARSSGTWFCWGINQNGVLGVGTTTNSGTPLKVLGQQ